MTDKSNDPFDQLPTLDREPPADWPWTDQDDLDELRRLDNLVHDPVYRKPLRLSPFELWLLYEGRKPC